MKAWVKEIIEDSIDGRPLRVGERVKHLDGRLVEITKGQFYGTYGVSNFWHWEEVLEDGSLGPEEHGYGWFVKENNVATTLEESKR